MRDVVAGRDFLQSVHRRVVPYWMQLSSAVSALGCPEQLAVVGSKQANSRTEASLSDLNEWYISRRCSLTLAQLDLQTTPYAS